MKVGIDTNFLIHVFRDTPTEDVVVLDLRHRARLLFQTLIENEDDILCPTVVGAEWLAGIEETSHAANLGQLEKAFVFVTFDPPAMSFAARVWREMRQFPKAEQPARQVLKADSLIVATLKSAGAARFYSHDTGARKMAQLIGMPAFDYPTHSPNLFAGIPTDAAPER